MDEKYLIVYVMFQRLGHCERQDAEDVIPSLISYLTSYNASYLVWQTLRNIQTLYNQQPVMPTLIHYRKWRQVMIICEKFFLLKSSDKSFQRQTILEVRREETLTVNCWCLLYFYGHFHFALNNNKVMWGKSRNEWQLVFKQRSHDVND